MRNKMLSPFLKSAVFFVSGLFITAAISCVFGSLALLASILVYSLLWVGLFFFHFYTLQRNRAFWLINGIESDASILERIRELLHQNRRHQLEIYFLKGILKKSANLIKDGLVLLDGACQIHWFNAAAKDHFSLREPEDYGIPLYTLVRQSGFCEYLQNPENATEIVLEGSGSRKDQILSICLVPFAAKYRLLWSCDKTDLRVAQNMRRDFIANISHEMRTPLTVIRGFLETFVTDLPNKRMLHQYLQLMLEQTERMQKLLNNLMALSRLESTPSVEEPEKVNLRKMLEVLWREMNALSQGQHRLLKKNTGPSWIWGCYDELYSAFANLIANAVYYTPQGGTILLSWIQKEKHPILMVKDTGIGIAPEHIRRLTERFYRVERGRSKKTGGTGLGLSIVYHVALRHQATLKIESELEKGSCFSLVFPSNQGNALL